MQVIGISRCAAAEELDCETAEDDCEAKEDDCEDEEVDCEGKEDIDCETAEDDCEGRAEDDCETAEDDCEGRAEDDCEGKEEIDCEEEDTREKVPDAGICKSLKTSFENSSVNLFKHSPCTA